MSSQRNRAEGAPANRPASARDVLAPRLPVELAPLVVPLWSPGNEWTGVEVAGDFSSCAGEGVEISGCRAHGAIFTAARLAGLRVADSLFVGCQMSGAIMTEARLARVAFHDCRLSGASLAQAKLQDVVFVDCRLDDADFRLAGGDHVQWHRSNLLKADFYGAHFTEARLFDCDLTGAEFSKSKLQGASLHGSTLADLRGASYLRDVKISTAQVLPLALQVFASFGIVVDDDR